MAKKTDTIRDVLAVNCTKRKNTKKYRCTILKDKDIKNPVLVDNVSDIAWGWRIKTQSVGHDVGSPYFDRFEIQRSDEGKEPIDCAVINLSDSNRVVCRLRGQLAGISR